MSVVPPPSLPPLVLRGFACDAAGRTAELRHSWIKNEILFLDPVDVVALHQQGSWKVLEVQFPNQLATLRDLAVNLLPSFSVSSILGTLEPFRRLSQADTARVRGVIDQHLSRNWDVSGAARQLLEAADTLSETYGALMELWNMRPHRPSDAKALAHAWEALRMQAELVSRTLDRLPTGYLVP